MSYQNGSIIAHKKSVQVDPRFVDFDEFADQLSNILKELDIPSHKREITRVKEKSIISERFFIELQTFKKLLTRSTFDHQEAKQYRQDFPIFRFPQERNNKKSSFVSDLEPIYSPYTLELALYFTLLRYKLRECLLHKQTPSILNQLYELVRWHNDNSLDTILSQVYRMAEFFVTRYGRDKVQIIKDLEAAEKDASRPHTNTWEPGKTYSCSCGWKGFDPIFCHAMMASSNPIRNFCPACHQRMGW